ncbi:MAG: mechanosensitive ion channel [Lachnospiraceae bacterium]|nr:mechanosensitive ion channel [Lachnospiraceae bacterium]
MILADINNADVSKFEAYMDKVVEWFLDKLLQIAIMLVFLFIAFKVAKLILKLIKRSFDKTKLDTSVSGFLLSLIKIVIYAIIIIMAAAMVGFQVTSLVTILGTASLAIGLALQGSLANFAGGVLILIMKPFKVGDYIIENDKKCEGTVESIDIFYTKLRTYDNKQIVIPNGNITNNSITNVTANKCRMLDLTFGISYNQDIKAVKEILLGILEASEYRLKDRAVNVFVDSLGESSIKIGARCWVDAADYWNAKWEITEAIKYAFDEHGIEIPYNQLDVNLKKE